MRPDDFFEICCAALKRDPEVFDLYYAPVTSEAALGLARHLDTSESEALEALVEAALDMKDDESWWAIQAAIRSWLDGEELDINPSWYWTYLYPAHRSHRPKNAQVTWHTPGLA